MQSTLPPVLIIGHDPALRRLVELVVEVSGLAPAPVSPDRVISSDLSAIIWDTDAAEIGAEDLMSEAGSIPVIVLTDPTPAETLIRYLSLGAHDIFFRPFDPEDLELALRLAVRTDAARDEEMPSFKHGPFTLDFGQFRAYWDKDPIALSYTEWRLLEILAERAGEPILHKEMLVRTWGPSVQGEIELLRAWISRLQAKIPVSNFQGVGYFLSF